MTHEVTLYHNPRCGTSRAALALLRAQGVEPRVVEYLRTPPDAAELARIIDLLRLEPRELMRRKETVYANAGLDDPALGRGDLIEAMVRHPILIERPIALANGRAVLGRPPQKILDVLRP
jgi:arsenate reductase (glutaredoxin)